MLGGRLAVVREPSFMQAARLAGRLQLSAAEGESPMRANQLISRTSAPDFTTKATEITETEQEGERVRIRLRDLAFPASVSSAHSVVEFRIAGRRIPNELSLAPMGESPKPPVVGPPNKARHGT